MLGVFLGIVVGRRGVIAEIAEHERLRELRAADGDGVPGAEPGDRDEPQVQQ